MTILLVIPDLYLIHSFLIGLVSCHNPSNKPKRPASLSMQVLIPLSGCSHSPLHVCMWSRKLCAGHPAVQTPCWRGLDCSRRASSGFKQRRQSEAKGPTQDRQEGWQSKRQMAKLTNLFVFFFISHAVNYLTVHVLLWLRLCRGCSQIWQSHCRKRDVFRDISISFTHQLKDFLPVG